MKIEPLNLELSENLKYKSNLKQETAVKLTKIINQDKVKELEIRIETLKELIK
jgi:hypothetical protein